MPNYTTAIKTARMTATRDLLANGTLEILDGATVLAVFGLSATGGTISNDTWTLALDAGTVSATDTGVADGAQIKDSGGTAQITGLTVGMSGSDINLDNTSINTGQDVTLSSASIQHAA